MKTSTVVRMFALASLALSPVLAGCGEGELELDTLPLVTEEDEKADTTAGTTYLFIRPLAGRIACFAPPCATAEARQVNSTKTELVYKFDWRGLKLSEEQVAQMEAQRATMLLSGKYTRSTAFGQPVKVFQVTRAAVPVSASSTDNLDVDAYYQVKANATVCVSDPCPSMDAQKLGSTAASTKWTSVDLGQLRVPQTVGAGLVSEIRAGKAFLSVSNVANQVANVTQVFRPHNAPTLR